MGRPISVTAGPFLPVPREPVRRLGRTRRGSQIAWTPGQLLLFLGHLIWETESSDSSVIRLLNNVVRSPKPSTPRCSCGPAGGLLQMQNHSPTPDLLKLNLHFNTFPGRLLDGHQSESRPGVCQTGSALVQILVLLLSCCAPLGKSLNFFDLWRLHI